MQNTVWLGIIFCVTALLPPWLGGLANAWALALKYKTPKHKTKPLINTLSRQVKGSFVRLSAVKHLQSVFALVSLSGAKDLDPHLLYAAPSLCSVFPINPLLS